MATGCSITLAGVTDAELIKILEIKGKNENKVAFNPQTMQPASINNRSCYNNVVLGLYTPEGVGIGLEILNVLAGK